MNAKFYFIRGKRAVEAQFQIEAPEPLSTTEMDDRLRHASGHVHYLFCYICFEQQWGVAHSNAYRNGKNT